MRSTIEGRFDNAETDDGRRHLSCYRNEDRMTVGFTFLGEVEVDLNAECRWGIRLSQAGTRPRLAFGHSTHCTYFIFLIYRRTYMPLSVYSVTTNKTHFQG